MVSSSCVCVGKRDDERACDMNEVCSTMMCVCVCGRRGRCQEEAERVMIRHMLGEHTSDILPQINTQIDTETACQSVHKCAKGGGGEREGSASKNARRQGIRRRVVSVVSRRL
jgi:hypothetical protein